MIDKELIKFGEKDKTSYPSDFVPTPKKNEVEWNIKYAKAFWAEFCKGVLDVLSTGTSLYDYYTLRSHADGTNDNSDVKHKLTIASKKTNDPRRKAYTSISWDNESVLPRYIDSVIGMLEGVDVPVTPRGVDQASFEGKQRMKHWIWERSKNPFYEQLAKKSGKQMVDDVPFVPADYEELEIFETMSMELEHEVVMKDAIDRCFQLSDWTDLDDLLKRDEIIIGLAGTKKYYDRASKKPLIKYIAPEDAVLPKSKFKDYRDARTVGHMERMTIHNLRNELKKVNKYESEAKFIERIRPCYGNQIGNFLGSSDWSYVSDANRDSHGAAYDNFMVTVFFVEHLTWNTDVYSTRKTKAAGEQTYMEEFGYEADKSTTVSRKTYEMRYECGWIVGTDLCINWGPVSYCNRDKKGKTYSNYSFYRCANRSITAAAIPKIKKLEVACKKFQIAWAQAAPNGFEVNWNALKGMTYNGKTLTEVEVMKIYLDTGKLFTNVDMNDQRKATYKTVTQLPGGLGTILKDFVGTYNLIIQELGDITGITQPLLGSQPQAGQLNGVTEMTLNGAQNRLKPIAKGMKSIKRRSARAICQNILTVLMFEGDIEETFYDLNAKKQRSLYIPADNAKYDYEMVIEEDYDELMKQEIITTAKESAQRGAAGDPTQLTFPDYLLILEQVKRGKIAFARALMEKRLNKRVLISQMTAAQNVEATAAAQQQSNQQAMQLKKGEIALNTQSQLEIDDNKSENKIKEIIVESELDKKKEGGEEKKQPPKKN
ncbi:MAG TPA: hypothetical protein PLJ00_05820 [Chitinophagales bacterium]|nr:hypothetical protein [Chitinophagales bacterium]